MSKYGEHLCVVQSSLSTSGQGESVKDRAEISNNFQNVSLVIL